jgi:two-component system, cell cycle response regulator DivK
MLEPGAAYRWTRDGEKDPRMGAGRESRGEIQPVARGRAKPSALRILLVEDDPDAQLVYRTILEHAGYRVDVRGNGRDAVALARASLPDLVIMDINLPVLGGWDAIELLRASAATRHIPVCVVSAGLTAGSNARALSLGCQALFAKPLRPRDLLTEVERLIGPSDR